MTARYRIPGRCRAFALACIAIAAAAPRSGRAEDAAETPAAPLGTAPAAAPADDELPMAPEEIVVLGRRRRGQATQDPTASATVIEAERFAGEAKGVAELASTAPGVAVHQYGGLGQLATASIRGSTANGVLVLLDGLPLNTAFGGGVDLSSIPRSWIDRIEIVRGAEGAHYGAGSLGGVVNVITRQTPPGTWSAEAGGGSFETFSASAEGAVERRGLALYLSGGAESTAGSFRYLWPSTPDHDPTLTASRRDNNGAARAGAMAKLAASIGDARLDVLGQLSAGHRGLPGWPYSLTADDWHEDTRAILSARLSAQGPRPGILLAARLSGRFDSLATRNGSALPRQRGGAAGIEGEARLLHGPGLLRVSLETEGEALRGTGLDGTLTRANLAATASEDLSLAGERLRIAPAVRAERVGRYRGLSAKLGASLRVAGPLALRASAGRTFRAPSFAELHLRQGLLAPNPELVPEEGLGSDAGLVLDSALAWASLGAHATLYRDLIYYQRVSFNQLRPFNAGKVLVRGLEAEAATAPARALLGLSLSASYTLLSTEILRGVKGTLGNEVPHRARHRLFARAAISPGPAEAHVEAHVVGRQWADAGNSSPIPSATVWNAGGSLRLARRAPELRLSVEVRNVLDDRAQQDGFGNPLPGRMMLVTLRAGSTPSEGRP